MPSLKKTLIATFVFAAVSAHAASVGNLKKEDALITTEANSGSQINLHTENGDIIQLSFLTPTMFRVWAGVGGKLIGSGDKAAPIVLPHTYSKVDVQMSDHGDYQ